ncbi:Imm53 family immunity protein [Anatilimnocola sp. NA78]|uniref:Imm53 family immunity protein n=1 Tax=Anatilimnocola sp. NA78 TaxID=3415683 RepID=UPI003CE51565
MPLDQSVEAINQWYYSKCNGQWEHHEGIRLESTDNPGWLATVNSLQLDNAKLSLILGELLRDYEAQVSTDGYMVRVFAPDLANCLEALGLVMTKAERTKA